jgi:hypothetical protein
MYPFVQWEIQAKNNFQINGGGDAKVSMLETLACSQQGNFQR